MLIAELEDCFVKEKRSGIIFSQIDITNTMPLVKRYYIAFSIREAAVPQA